jgi:hypothetical protein
MPFSLCLLRALCASVVEIYNTKGKIDENYKA